MRFIIDVIFTVIQTRIINTRIPGNTLVNYNYNYVKFVYKYGS